MLALWFSLCWFRNLQEREEGEREAGTKGASKNASPAPWTFDATFFDHMRYFAELCEEPGGELDPATALRELAAQATQLDSPLFTSLQKATSDTASDRLVHLLLLVLTRTSVTSLVDLASLKLTPGKLAAPKALTCVIQCSQDKGWVHEDAKF